MSDALTWKALADPTRRAILDRLRRRPQTTGELCAQFPEITRVATMRHLAVLEAADLIFIRREGRYRWNHLNPVPIRRIYERWVKPYEAVWAEPGLALKRHVEGKKGRRHERAIAGGRH